MNCVLCGEDMLGECYCWKCSPVEDGDIERLQARLKEREAQRTVLVAAAIKALQAGIPDFSAKESLRNAVKEATS